MRGQLVRRLDQLLHLRIGRVQRVLVGGAQLRGQHAQQLFLRHLLHGLVRLTDGGVVVFDRGGHVAGEDLPGVVVQRGHGHRTGVHLSAEFLVAQHRQRVRQHRHLMAVLLDVLGIAVAHQRPALDEAHTVDIGEKVIHVMSTPLSAYHRQFLLSSL